MVGKSVTGAEEEEGDKEEREGEEEDVRGDG